MNLGRLGVWYSTDKLDAAQLRALLSTVEKNGYTAFWYPESRGYESIALASYLLANSSKLVIGSSIANIYARDSFTSRRAMLTLNAFHGDRFVLGLGVSHIPMVEGLRGHTYEKPIPAMRSYLASKQVRTTRMYDRRRQLIDALYRGDLRLEYDAATTRTAAEAFDARSGNCLALVLMTSAFAKNGGNSTATDALWHPGSSGGSR